MQFETEKEEEDERKEEATEKKATGSVCQGIQSRGLSQERMMKMTFRRSRQAAEGRKKREEIKEPALVWPKQWQQRLRLRGHLKYS